MCQKRNLPFKVGDLVEARSFETGFRSAWFRCKIKEISWSKGDLGYVLDYFDYTDVEPEWTKAYQVPPNHAKKSKKKERVLMVRPCYPAIYRENQIPEVRETSEVVVIVNDAWRVGDLVDWWTDGCYWSGRITQLLGNEKVQVDLPPKPLGEGKSYDNVLVQDLRPSLSWCPVDGWTLPTPDGHLPYARLIQPANPVIQRLPAPDTNKAGQRTDPLLVKVGSSSSISLCTPISTKTAASDETKSTRKRENSSRNNIAEEVLRTEETNMTVNGGDSGKRGASLSGSVSSSHRREAAPESVDLLEEHVQHSNSTLKKLRTSEGVTLNSMRSDTLEAAVMDLEELVNKVKWMKALVEHGISLPDAAMPKWKFVEHRATSSWLK